MMIFVTRKIASMLTFRDEAHGNGFGKHCLTFLFPASILGVFGNLLWAFPFIGNAHVISEKAGLGWGELGWGKPRQTPG